VARSDAADALPATWRSRMPVRSRIQASSVPQLFQIGIGHHPGRYVPTHTGILLQWSGHSVSVWLVSSRKKNGDFTQSKRRNKASCGCLYFRVRDRWAGFRDCAATQILDGSLYAAADVRYMFRARFPTQVLESVGFDFCGDGRLQKQTG